MKIHKNLFGTNGEDKIHVDEIAIAQDLLLGQGVIVESGSNEYGSYEKFGSGLMICQIDIPAFDLEFGSYGGAFRTDYYDFITPQEFVGYATVAGSSVNPLNYGIVVNYGYSLASKVARIRAWANEDKTGSSVGTMRLTIIGMWK